MNWLYILGSMVISYMAMEGVAWWTHKYVMHGWLWHWHADHHRRDARGAMERNDRFFAVFAIPGILCLAAGLSGNHPLLLGAGIGITAYGVTYVLVHDVLVHGRWIKRWRMRNRYLDAIRRAHHIHHRTIDRDGASHFGLLWVPRGLWETSGRSSTGHG